MYAVCVTFEIVPQAKEAFLLLMNANARQSLRAEPGCHQFDVLTDAGKPGQIFLYELYTDRAAFDAHLASDHFKEFDAAVGPMIASKAVQTWDSVTQ